MTQPMSIMGFVATSKVMRWRVLKGETLKEARERWRREELIERARLNDPRREQLSSGCGRIAPVFYND